MRTRQERKTQIHRVGIIAEQDVDCVFDDGRIRSMAAAHKLPSGTDLPRLGAAVRDAARIYAREAQIPNRNELHDEISTLYRLADKKQFVQLAAALEGLSSEVRELLTSRCIGELPSSQVLRCIEFEGRRLPSDCLALLLWRKHRSGPSSSRRKAIALSL